MGRKQTDVVKPVITFFTFRHIINSVLVSANLNLFN